MSLLDVAEKSGKRSSKRDEVYVGKYLPVDGEYAELCKLLDIPPAVGGTAVFRAMLRDVIMFRTIRNLAAVQLAIKELIAKEENKIGAVQI